jgi:hypothetical protein
MTGMEDNSVLRVENANRVVGIHDEHVRIPVIHCERLRHPADRLGAQQRPCDRVDHAHAGRIRAVRAAAQDKGMAASLIHRDAQRGRAHGDGAVQDLPLQPHRPAAEASHEHHPRHDPCPPRPASDGGR